MQRYGAPTRRADVSGESELQHSWCHTHFTLRDLTRVWFSLVRGEQLNEEVTAYLPDRAMRPIPVAFA